MIDPTQILVDNLTDAFKQLNRFLALGLVASVSALALDRRHPRESEAAPVAIGQGFPQCLAKPRNWCLWGSAS
jgi:hypothetical protein